MPDGGVTLINIAAYIDRLFCENNVVYMFMYACLT